MQRWTAPPNQSRWTSQCDSKEALAIFIWTCGHGAAVREAKDRFERSLDTISRKCSLLSQIMHTWSNTIIVPSDPQYNGVHIELQPFAPHFDGCIGAIDGTHIPVEVKRHRKLDHIKSETLCIYKCVCHCGHA
jgi:hypothetical protein